MPQHDRYVPSSNFIAIQPNYGGKPFGFQSCETDADCNESIWTGGLCVPTLQLCGAKGTRESDKAFSQIAELLAYGKVPEDGSGGIEVDSDEAVGRVLAGKEMD
jgi:hypothetical protein